MRRLSICLPFFLSLGVGCTTSAPTPVTGLPGADGGTTTPTGGPDMMPDPSVVGIPVLDPVGQTTVYDTVPIHGVADPNTTVLVETMDHQTTSVDVDASGRFCIDLPLQHDKTNKFQIAALNKEGTESDIVPLSVRQSGTPAQAPTAPSPVNMAQGGDAQSYRIGAGLFSVDPALAVDGSSGTALEGYWYDPWRHTARDPIVVVKLASASRVNKIRGIAPTDCLFESPLQLYYSSLDAPSPPDVKISDWVAVNSVRDSAKQSVVANFNSAIVTHVAAVWNDHTTRNCGSLLTGAYYGIAELQAWSVPNQAPPPPAIPSCTSGY